MEKKIYYSITDIRRDLKLEAYTIRYWENEFKQLKSIRKPGANRKYSYKQYLLFKKIQDLLHNQKVTIKGVKKILNSSEGTGFSIKNESQKKKEILNRINRIKNLLSSLIEEA